MRKISSAAFVLLDTQLTYGRHVARPGNLLRVGGRLTYIGVRGGRLYAKHLPGKPDLTELLGVQVERVRASRPL